MAQPFKCNTKSPLGNLILGILFLLCGLLLLSMPCLGLAGTMVGWVTLPKDSHETLGTLCVLGFSLVLAAVLLALGVLCMKATLLPKTLEITDEGIELRWFTKRLGKVPFANMKNAIVKTRAMAGQTADSASFQAFLAGGFIAAMIARNRFDPNEPIGFIIQLEKAGDPDTFWPRSIFKRSQKKRLEVHYYWKVSHTRLVQKIDRALSRYNEEERARDC
jgi:hypothetical protein